MKGTTEHTEYTESRSAKEPSVCSVYSVVGEGTTEHTEYTGSRSAKEPSVCPVYSVVEKGTTEHTEYTESRSAKEPSVYSVVERTQVACDVYTFCRFLNTSRMTCILSAVS